MATPVEGNIFSKGDIRTLTFVLGFNLAPLGTQAGKLYNLTTGNNLALNNAQITVADNATGTITITANLNETGDWLAQFSSNNATLKSYSPVFSYKVTTPVL